MRKCLTTYLILLFSVLAWAQNGTTVASGIPYECSFEETENLTAWRLNDRAPGRAVDKWIFGTAVHSEGKRSMYISADGLNPTYGANKKSPYVAVSYLRYRFPHASNKQNYDVSFDWRGVGDSTTSKLYVLFCLESEWQSEYAGKCMSSTNLGLNSDVAGVCQLLGENADLYLCGSEAWQNVSFSNKVGVSGRMSDSTFIFAFIWYNNNSNDSVANSSLAVDNFQINSASISKPQNLIVYPHCEDSTLIVTWESGLPTFDIQYRKVGETSWTHGTSGITEGGGGFQREDGVHCTYALRRILEGSYDVRIRGAYDALKTNYVYQTNILVYCPENHCVNYVDLDDPSVVCTYGYFPDYNNHGETPYDSIGKIDFGPDAAESRHTLHIDPTEVDPRTDSLLHTVPPGALASVRLGNWKWGGEAESITYTIHVDSANQGILIVQYAVVFEDPGHEDEPQFELVILDQNDSIIDPDCGHAVFTYSDAVEAGWNMSSDGHVAWKDWTTVGLNLMQYHGQNIKVRFTTMDCGWGGHFGYAYFTVDCANAHIETENCGNDASVTCVAPEGFAYQWRDETNLVVSEERVFMVDAGMHTYTCKVSFIESPDCYFEISTLSAPRFPVPDYSFERIYEQCQSKLKFTNTSHVMNKFEGFENHTDEPCNAGRWSFKYLSDGTVKETTEWSPTFIGPEEGDTIVVTYTAYIGADNACDSARIDTIIMPNIVPKDSVVRMTTCPETPISFDGKWFNTDTVYRAKYPNFAGCDSVAKLYLTVWPEIPDTHIHDSICSDQAVIVNGVRYNQPMENKLIMLKSSHGCDSALYLTLTVNTRLDAQIEQMPFVCADDEQLYMNFSILAGEYDSLSIKFSSPVLRDTMIYDHNVRTVSIPYPDTITPGMYRATLSFYQFCCGIYQETRDIEIRYRSSIVEQKWNDVLSVLSPKYNGGFEFTAFQWFKDDMPLEGETHSYLYQPLDENATYYVALTTADGQTMTTCPIQPVYHEQQTDYPTIVKAGKQIPMYMEQPATIWYYTVSGQLVSSFGLPQGYTSLTTPNQTGVYVIKAVYNDGQTHANVMIVE